MIVFIFPVLCVHVNWCNKGCWKNPFHNINLFCSARFMSLRLLSSVMASPSCQTVLSFGLLPYLALKSDCCIVVAYTTIIVVSGFGWIRSSIIEFFWFFLDHIGLLGSFFLYLFHYRNCHIVLDVLILDLPYFFLTRLQFRCCCFNDSVCFSLSFFLLGTS